MSSNFRGDNSLAAGAGWAGGHSALAVGYRHVLEDGHVSVSVHGAISGFERSLGAGVGYSW
jgi:autotransporter adhesin